MNRVKYTAVFLSVLSVLSLGGCGGKGAVNTDSMKLTVGLMPAVDSAPMLLAEKKGYFRQAGLDVKLQIYTNAQDRQSALQASSIDGAITDFIAVAANVDSGFDIKAVTMTNGVFPVLVNSDSKDKKDIKVGMMEVSVTNFLIDLWLSDKYNVEKVFIDEIPARLAAIESGRTDMGLFPEPVASMGELSGLTKKMFDAGDGNCPDVMVFTGKALKSRNKAIRLFLDACNKAVDDINADPGEARSILMEKIPNLKPEVKDMMVLPTYTKASLPNNKYIESIIEWTAKTIKKNLKVKPEDLVDRNYI